MPAILLAPYQSESHDVPGVVAIKRVRIRRSGPEAFADVWLTVNRGAAFEHTHDIASHVEEAVRGLLPGADVVVQTEADELEVRRTLGTMMEETGIDCRPHAITIRRDGDELALTFHCIADPDASITDAHELSVRVESFLRKEIPGLRRVIIHMEPSGA